MIKYELLIFWDGIEQPDCFDFTEPIKENLDEWLGRDFGKQFKKKSKEIQMFECFKDIQVSMLHEGRKTAYINNTIINVKKIRMIKINIYEVSEEN
jgi:hypothetical protein